MGPPEFAAYAALDPCSGHKGSNVFAPSSEFDSTLEKLSPQLLARLSLNPGAQQLAHDFPLAPLAPEMEWPERWAQVQTCDAAGASCMWSCLGLPDRVHICKQGFDRGFLNACDGLVQYLQGAAGRQARLAAAAAARGRPRRRPPAVATARATAIATRIGGVGTGEVFIARHRTPLRP